MGYGVLSVRRAAPGQKHNQGGGSHPSLHSAMVALGGPSDKPDRAEKNWLKTVLFDAADPLVTEKSFPEQGASHPGMFQRH